MIYAISANIFWHLLFSNDGSGSTRDRGTWKLWSNRSQPSQPAVCIVFCEIWRFSWQQFATQVLVVTSKKTPKYSEELNFQTVRRWEYFLDRNLNFNVLVNFILFHPLAIYIYIISFVDPVDPLSSFDLRYCLTSYVFPQGRMFA